MKNRLILSLSFISLTFLISSCGSKPVYVDPGSGQGVVSITAINIQDFQTAAGDLVQKMLLHPDFAKYSSANKAQLHLSNFTNDTGKSFNMDFLLADVRSQLLGSGKFKISRIHGRSGTDTYAKELTELNQLQTGTIGKLPSYVLSGEIRELRAYAGKTTQSSFQFNLIATDLEGNSIFEDSKTITKQGKKSTIGF
jgi:PBP1b-binding outer membrane lipoprotein LpoB